jgi:hypothetical protein
MVDKQAAALIFENIAMLEDAMKLANGELGEIVFAAIDEKISRWRRDMGWEGESALWTDESSYFGPAEWRVGSGDEEAWTATYYISWDDPDGESYLTLLLGARQGRMGLEFAVEYKDVLEMKKTQWRKLAHAHNEQHPDIEGAGFQYDAKEGAWFLPWKIDAQHLAEAYANDAIEDALQPLGEALDRIKSVHAAFMELVDAVQRQCGAHDDDAEAAN